MRERKDQRRILAWGYPLILATFIMPRLDHRFGWSAPARVAVGRQWHRPGRLSDES